MTTILQHSKQGIIIIILFFVQGISDTEGEEKNRKCKRWNDH